MPLLPEFNQDIFISYCAEDNIAGPGQTEGWVELFQDKLNLLLARRFGSLDSVSICQKNKIPGGDAVMDSSLESRVKNSAILICINSAGYANSEECQQELSWFYNKAKSEKPGLKIGYHTRIVHVLLNNIPIDKWPPELRNSHPFPFYGSQKASDPEKPVKTDSPSFRKEIENLAANLWKLLTDMGKEESGDMADPNLNPQENKEGFLIYMGEVAENLRIPRKRIINELASKGYHVLTNSLQQDESSAHEQATNESLRKADIAVHLLDELPGRQILENPDLSYPQKETELAMKSGKPQMIWVPAHLDITNLLDKKYKLFLQSLEKGNDSNKGYEFLRGDKCTLTRDIIDFAEHIKAQPGAGHNNVSLMLDTHYCDQAYAMYLGKILSENRIRTFINPQEGDPRKNIHLMGERLRQVNKLMFLYGQVSKEWLRERMSAALEFIITNNYPITDFVIYMAPPGKEEKTIFFKQKFLKINVINNSNQAVMNQQNLETFLNSINATKE